MEKFYKIEIEQHGDERGCLTLFEHPKNVPFEIKRVYYLSGIKEGKKRACHAHRNSQRLTTAVCGSCEATLFDGKNKETFLLNSQKEALFFDKGVWCELNNFSPDAVLLLLASEPYDESEYIRDYNEFLTYIGENQ